MSVAPDRRKVFVIHGRDEQARQALFSFLRELDLHPLEWEELVAATGSATLFTGHVVARAFAEAQAAVVLFTPDDVANLHPSLHQPAEPAYETEPTGQPRPNVLLEAGMALGTKEDRTILIEVGALRPVSDLFGRNVVRLDGTRRSIRRLVQRLQAAGCVVNDAGTGWDDVDRFCHLDALTRRPMQGAPLPGRVQPGELPRGGYPVSLAAAGVTDHHLELFRVTPQGMIDHRWFPDMPGRWSHWQQMEAPVAVSGVTAAAHSEFLDLFALDSSNRLHHRWWGVREGWSSWETWGNVRGPLAAASLDPNHVEVYFWDDSANLVTAYQSGGRWTDWATPDGSHHDYVPLALAAAGVPGHHLELFRVTPQATIDHRWFPDRPEHWSWSAWQHMEVPAPMVDVAAAARNWFLDLFALDSSNRLHHRWWGVREGWSSWETWGNVLGPVAAASLNSHHVEIYAWDGSGRLRTRYREGGRWTEWAYV